MKFINPPFIWSFSSVDWTTYHLFTATWPSLMITHWESQGRWPIATSLWSPPLQVSECPPIYFEVLFLHQFQCWPHSRSMDTSRFTSDSSSAASTNAAISVALTIGHLLPTIGTTPLIHFSLQPKPLSLELSCSSYLFLSHWEFLLTLQLDPSPSPEIPGPYQAETRLTPGPCHTQKLGSYPTTLTF